MTIGDQSMPMFQDEDTHRIHWAIYLSIYEIYIAPLQGNYSDALIGVSVFD